MTKTGKWKSIREMSDKTGIPNQTLYRILEASKEREEFHLGGTSSWRDIDRTKALKDQPETRKKLLDVNNKNNSKVLKCERL